MNDTEIGFTLQLLATLIGAFVGFGLAILWKWKANQRKLKEIKKKILDSIISEISQIKTEMKKEIKIGWNTDKHEFNGDYATISLTSFDNALYSGNLVQFPTNLQIKVSLLNDRIKLYDFFQKESLTIHKMGFQDKERLRIEAVRLIANITKQQSQIMKNIEEVSPILESERKKL